MEFEQKKGRAAQSLNLHTEQHWFSLANENAVLAFKKFLFLLKHNDGSVIHSILNSYTIHSALFYSYFPVSYVPLANSSIPMLLW